MKSKKLQDIHEPNEVVSQNNIPETPEQEIFRLRMELDYYRRDGMEGSYYALNYQLNKLNEIIREASITLTGKDKAFERFWLILTQIKEVHSSIAQLKMIVFGDKNEPKKGNGNISFMDEMNSK